ncbi:YopX family protein [Pediococcus pentosaceus]|uniref:YopX family protein n=1 Tax=Pediococcus pentosaceus TaxID=1255 RepID=UPI001F5AFB70|nr:YopX family protein [Pediococcus pentosaceus]MCI2960317.1 YopX family protein [Pediococcus pentosaceus]
MLRLGGQMMNFRAWDIHEKRMLKVYRLSFDGPIEGTQVHCYLDDRGDKGSKEYSYDGDGLILEQSTDMKDVNGKEIYVGDIVEATIEGYVQADKYLVKNTWDPHVWTEESDSYYAVSKMEVVGNVHENPELLEVEDE